MIETGPAKARVWQANPGVFHPETQTWHSWFWRCGDCVQFGHCSTMAQAHIEFDAHARSHWQMFVPPAYYYTEGDSI